MRSTCPRSPPRKRPSSSPIWRLRKCSAASSGRWSARDIRGIDVEVEGAAAELNIKPVTGAVLAGVMSTWSDTVNMVNAPFLAKERGLDVREIRSTQEGDYHTLVAVIAGTDDGSDAGRGHLVRQPRAAPGQDFRDSGRGRADRPDDLYRQHRHPRVHRRARHHARQGGAQYRDLQPRPPRGGRRGGRLGRGRRPDHSRDRARALRNPRRAPGRAAGF